MILGRTGSVKSFPTLFALCSPRFIRKHFCLCSNRHLPPTLTKAITWRVLLGFRRVQNVVKRGKCTELYIFPT
jgi:hypothetical protein